MKNIAQLMASYESYHQRFITKLTHFIGIPSIIFAILIILNWIPLPFLPIHLSWISILILSAYYIFLDINIGLMTSILLLTLAITAQLIASSYFNWYGLFIFICTFTFGWIAQLLGHRYEGNRPAFLTNAFQILIAPLFLCAEIAFIFGYQKKLRQAVSGMFRS